MQKLLLATVTMPTARTDRSNARFIQTNGRLGHAAIYLDLCRFTLGTHQHHYGGCLCRCHMTDRRERR